jgi:hypothetical protein
VSENAEDVERVLSRDLQHVAQLADQCRTRQPYTAGS